MRPKYNTPSLHARYAGWATQPWSDIDTETLEDGNKGLMKMIRAFSNTNQVRAYTLHTPLFCRMHLYAPVAHVYTPYIHL